MGLDKNFKLCFRGTIAIKTPWIKWNKLSFFIICRKPTAFFDDRRIRICLTWSASRGMWEWKVLSDRLLFVWLLQKGITSRLIGILTIYASKIKFKYLIERRRTVVFSDNKPITSAFVKQHGSSHSPHQMRLLSQLNLSTQCRTLLAQITLPFPTR